MLYKNGLGKLVEELGELVQIVGKKMAFFHTDIHPDGKGSMKRRMEEEIADVFAAGGFVIDKMGLDEEFIAQRIGDKRDLYDEWERLPDEIV